MGTVHQGQSRGKTFAGYSDLEVEVCTCGVLFAAPKHLLDNARESGKNFYCPNGHSLVYSSENERLKKQLQQARDRAGRLASDLDQTQARLIAQKSATTRIKRERDSLKERTAAGVCPCCNRTFQQLARHIKTKHPDYQKA